MTHPGLFVRIAGETGSLVYAEASHFFCERPRMTHPSMRTTHPGHIPRFTSQRGPCLNAALPCPLPCPLQPPLVGP